VPSGKQIVCQTQTFGSSVNITYHATEMRDRFTHFEAWADGWAALCHY